MREFAVFLMRSLWSAGTVSGLFGVWALKFPPVALLSAAILALAALRKGVWHGLAVAAVAGIVVAMAWPVLGSRPGLDFPLVFALWPPLLLAAETLRRTESQGLALLVVGLTVAACLVGMHGIVGDVVGFWREWLGRAVEGVPGATVRGFEESDTLRLMNGFLGMLYGLSLMSSLLFGRWLQSLVYNPGGFAREFQGLRLPRLTLLGAAAAVSGAGFWNEVLVADLFMLAMLLYLFVGLAVAHGVIAVRRMAWGWLVPVYVALVYLPPFAIPGLALLGALDTFVDFRTQRPRK